MDAAWAETTTKDEGDELIIIGYGTHYRLTSILDEKIELFNDQNFTKLRQIICTPDWLPPIDGISGIGELETRQGGFNFLLNIRIPSYETQSIYFTQSFTKAFIGPRLRYLSQNVEPEEVISFINEKEDPDKFGYFKGECELEELLGDGLFFNEFTIDLKS